ncbi:MAG: hypothetical protein QOH70_3271 [Blastocatellia bacterium]|nr:hypothetical protein [Blastocatellia bacterium]
MFIARVQNNPQAPLGTKRHVAPNGALIIRLPRDYKYSAPNGASTRPGIADGPLTKYSHLIR